MRELTAGALIEQLGNIDPGVIALNLIVCALGVVFHYVKKVSVEKVGWKAYWLDHRKSSMVAIGGIAVSCLSLLIVDPTAPIYTYFTLGYIGDSVLNRTGFVNDAIDKLSGDNKNTEVINAVMDKLAVVKKDPG